MTPPTFGAADFVPATRALAGLARAARDCRGCPLYQRATQVVFGEGRKRARLMLVGAMPGDQKDLAGRPFVGPAGRLLNRALREAGIDRADPYATNVVKHFKWQPHARRRLHQMPGLREISACLPWLEAELQATATGHPSAVLRQRSAEARARALATLIEDLGPVRAVLAGDHPA